MLTRESRKFVQSAYLTDLSLYASDLSETVVIHLMDQEE